MKEKIFLYLKNLFLCILIINFITSFFSFCLKINSFLMPTKISKDPTNSSLLKKAQEIEKDLNKLTTDLKDNYGESYPALGISYYQSILHYSSNDLVRNFLFSITFGFMIGNLIYFIFINKKVKFNLFFCIVISLFFTAFLFGLTDILINYANNEDFNLTINHIIWIMEIISIPGAIISLLLIGIQKIYSTYIEIRYS